MKKGVKIMIVQHETAFMQILCNLIFVPIQIMNNINDCIYMCTSLMHCMRGKK